MDTFNLLYFSFCPLIGAKFGSEGQSINYLVVEAFQQKGFRQVAAYGYAIFPDDPSFAACTGTPMRWEATISSSTYDSNITGLWQPGPVSIVARAAACYVVDYEWGADCDWSTLPEELTVDARIHAGQ